MNIEQPRQNNLHSSDLPIQTMMTELDDFANKIGGQPWQNGQTRKVEMERSLDLYLDEDVGESFDKKTYSINKDKPGVETIKMRFNAKRIMPEIANQPFTNLYKITHSHYVPIYDLLALPHEIRGHVAGQYNKDSNKKIHKKRKTNPLIVNERHKMQYIIDADDEAIHYRTQVDYIGDMFHIESDMYRSNRINTVVHMPHVDNHAEEHSSSYEDVEQEQITDVDEAMRVTIAFHNYIKKEMDRPMLVGQTYEVHAARIMALLAMMKSGIYPDDHITVE